MEKRAATISEICAFVSTHLSSGFRRAISNTAFVVQPPEMQVEEGPCLLLDAPRPTAAEGHPAVEHAHPTRRFFSFLFFWREEEHPSFAGRQLECCRNKWQVATIQATCSRYTYAYAVEWIAVKEY